MKTCVIWLIAAPILIVAALYVAILRPDLLQPVARGLSGHYYISEGDGIIRCYDLTNSTKSVVTNTVIGGETMTAWNVNYDNTRFIAAYCAIGKQQFSYCIRRYNIRGSKLMIDRQGSRPMDVNGSIKDISISPDGRTCALVIDAMTQMTAFNTEFYDLDTCTKLNIVLPSCNTVYPQAPKWDKTGCRFAYENKWGHMVIHDMVRKTNTILPDVGIDLSISPDSKLAYVYQYEDDPPYLRRLDDNSVVPLNNKESLVNWSPDSQGYDFNSLHIILYSLHYYDIKTGRSYRMPVPFKGTITRWVR